MAMTYSLGAGNDVFDNNYYNVVVDKIFGQDGNDTIWTGAGDDYLDGGSGNDALYGELGNDVLSGGAGADTLDGGEGNDTADYTASTAGVTVSLATGVGTGGDAQGDRLVSIENLAGSTQADILTGDANANILNGGAGDDKLNGGAGADQLIGGDGSDTADYSASTAAVNVNLETGIGKGGDAEGDKLTGIENLVGSRFNDYLVGNADTNRIDGGDGDDTITGGSNDDKMYGGAGNDTFLVEWSYHGDSYDGGDGIDTFSADIPTLDGYVQEIDLATGTNNWEDKFVSIENLIGGANNDKFWGTDGINVFWGRGGNDLLDGRGGDDKLYGEAGDDTLLGGAGNDVLDGGIGNDNLVGGAGADQLIGGDGNDTADYSGSSAGVKVNLATGVGSGGDAEGDKLSTIENVTGSNFADLLTGDAGANILKGGAGNDVLVGSGGGDVMDGGSDNDAADYSNSNAGVTVNLALGTGLGGFAQGDKLISIENVTGSAFADILIGDAGTNLLRGGAGNDVLVGSGGGDTMDGGADNDTADYSASNAGVTVNLALGTGLGGFAQGDKLISVENVIGSSFADILTGDAGANALRAGAGNDVLVGSGGGDIMDGGADTDTADYSASNAAVTVNLATGLGFGGTAEGDKFISVENVTGSKFNDLLTGDAGNNSLNGGLGNDTVAGGLGADVLKGGDGIDLADYSASSAGVTVNLSLGTGLGGDAEGDTLSGIENLTGSKFADNLTGDAGKNLISGGDGNDHLYGSGGGDVFDGGAGVDWIDYRNSTAAVYVNLALGIGKGGFAEGDTYKNIEDIRGSKFGDTLIGDDNANVIYAGKGQDIIQAGGGNDKIYSGGGYDTIDGGAGADTLSYLQSWAAVTVNLGTGIGKYGEASQDTISNIENLEGSKFNDVMTGDANANKLYGLDGDDTLNGGAGDDTLFGGIGADALIGGDGQDTASYSTATSGVALNLATGGTVGDAAGDTYVTIEQVIGSAYDDQITGDNSDNRISGGAGNDAIDGAGGIDYLYGDTGNDTLTGGAGADVFVYTKGFGQDTITDFWAGAGRTDRVWLQGTDLKTYADILSHATDVSGGVLLKVDAGADSIFFAGITVAQLNSDDFIFA